MTYITIDESAALGRDPAPSPRSPREQAEHLLETFAAIQKLVDANTLMSSSDVSIMAPGMALDVIKELALDDEINISAIHYADYGKTIFMVQNDHSQHCKGIVKWSVSEAL